jgi:N-acetyl-anhydromuramoyl-L-alanine amidase
MKPIIIEQPSEFYRERDSQVDMLVVHAMAEWVKGDEGIYYCLDWLNKLELSVHAYCLPDGRIIQSVDPDHVAFHAAEFNNCSIGMEFIVLGVHNYDTFLNQINDPLHSPFTQAQYQSGGWWYSQMAETYGLDYNAIKSHQEIAPNRKPDPGNAFKWNTFKAAFNDQGLF